MWSNKIDASLKGLQEKEIIQRISQILGSASLKYPAGIGDDCAVLPREKNDNYLLATTDSVVVNKHFTHETEGFRVGKKLINRNISDIAAMGGNPKHALLNIISCPSLSLSWFESFIEGIKKACLEQSIHIIGGDLSSNTEKQFVANVSLYGESNKPVLRNKTCIGDYICVTGTLGGSIISHHLDFIPRIKEAQYLAQTPFIHSMMDLTDGIAKDLKSLLSYKRIGALLDLDNIPLSKDAHTLSEESGKTALHHALTDGEDYELLFTLDAKTNWDDFIKQWQATHNTPISCIGKVIEKEGIYDSKNFEPLKSFSGYEHF